jgi:hypothetical protein
MAADKSRVLAKVQSNDSYQELKDEGWRELEKLWTATLPPNLREKIETGNRVYAMIGPLHERSSVTVVKAEKALSDWIKASGRLRLELCAETTSARTLSKREVVERFCKESAARKISKMRPLSFAQYVIEAAIGAAQFAIAEIKCQNMDPGLKRDLWFAWVGFLACVAEEVGVKITASSSNKSRNESRFVRGIMALQQRLPKECRRFNGYESVAKGVQEARRKFGKEDPATLLAIIAAWGANLPGFDSRNRAEARAVIGKLRDRIESKKRGRTASRPS